MLGLITNPVLTKVMFCSYNSNEWVLNTETYKGI